MTTTDLAAIESADEVLVPDFSTGEVVDVMKNPERIPGLVETLRETKRLADDHLRTLTAMVELLSEQRGTRTLPFGDRKVSLGTATETIYDVTVLEELRAAGLPEDRFDELVRAEVSYKVNASVAKQLAGANPEYAKIVERSKTVVPKRVTLSVK